MWFKVDDTFPLNPKVIQAGNAAIGLWVRAGAYCMQQLTDGHITDDMVRVLGGRPRDTTALVRTGLWHAEHGGYAFHDWAQYQPTKAKVQHERAEAAERMRRGRERARRLREEAENANVRQIRPT